MTKLWRIGRSIVPTLLCLLVIRASVVEANWVPTGSMLPTIQLGDHLLVNKMAYALRLPLIGTELVRTGTLQRGDVVVFRSPVDGRTWVKRAMAVAGDTVEIRSKVLYVNGEEADNPHADFSGGVAVLPGRDTMRSRTVPEGKVFVLGDNRDNSYDSRFWGFLDEADIAGKAMVIFWSREGWLAAPRLDRIGLGLR